MKRNATAVWQGSIKEGSGKVSTQSTVLKDTAYSFKSRFEEGIGTNPEELIAAAHASCFAMKLSLNISEAGFTAETLDAKCDINLDTSKGEISESHITLHAKVPNISKDKFDELVADAEKNCPISKLLNTKITVDATLA